MLNTLFLLCMIYVVQSIHWVYIIKFSDLNLISTL